MMKGYLKILIICLICILAIGAVSASELDNETADAPEVDDDVSADMQNHIELIGMSNDEDVLEDTPGTFSQLKSMIDGNDSGSTIYLDKNYVSDGYDSDGIVIDKEITIDGRGHTLDAQNSSGIFNVHSEATKVILKNITFKNANGNALYFEYVEDVIIENSKFADNCADYGTIYFTGGNLTISDCEFVNSTACFTDSYDDEEVMLYGYAAWLTIQSYGNVSISRTDFTDSKFYQYGISVEGGENLIFDDLRFKDNMGLMRTAVSIEPFVFGCYYCEGNLIGAFGFDNVSITNSDFDNNSVMAILSVESGNLTLKDSNFTNSKSGCALYLQSSGAVEVDGIIIDNITTMCGHDEWDEELQDCVYCEEYFSNELSFILLYNFNPETGFEDNNSIVIKNTVVRNIDTNYESLFTVVAYNLYADNLNISDIVRVSYDSDYYETFQLFGDGYLYNVDISNFNVENITTDRMFYVLYREDAMGNTTIKDASISNISFCDSDGLIYIYNNHDAPGIIVSLDSISLSNIYPSYNDASKGEFVTGFGASLCRIVSDSNVTISNFDVSDVCIYGGISVEALNVFLSDIKMHDAYLDYANGLISAFCQGDAFLENVLIDNLTASVVYDEYHDEYRNGYSLEIGSNSPSIVVYSNGNAFLNNVSIVNCDSSSDGTVGDYEGLFFVYASGNVTAQDVMIENISACTRYVSMDFDNLSTCFWWGYGPDITDVTMSGSVNNGITIVSQEGNVEIKNFTVDTVSNGFACEIEEGWDNHYLEYFTYFMNVSAVNIAIEDLTINNASIGGLKDGKAIVLNASNNLIVDTLSFTNISPAVAYNSSYYNATSNKLKCYCQLPDGDAGIFAYAMNLALSNLNISNTSGGSGEGSLVINAGNADVENVTIENIGQISGMAILYNDTLDEFINASDKTLMWITDGPHIEGDLTTLYNYFFSDKPDKGSSAPGITIKADNVTLNNYILTDCECGGSYDFYGYHERYCSAVLLDIYQSNSNVEVSNVVIRNIVGKNNLEYYYDDEKQYYVTWAGEMSPYFSISCWGNITLYNVCVDNVESSGGSSFLSLVDSCNCVVENVSISDSAIGFMEGGAIDICVGNLTLNNLIVDNIYGVLPYNFTTFVRNYTEGQGYAYAKESYEYSYLSDYCGFSVSIISSILNLSQLNITNIFRGGSDGSLIIESSDVVADGILIENISSAYGYWERFESGKASSYPVDCNCEGGLKIFEYSDSPGNVVLSNIKLNNIDVMQEYITINADYLTAENFTISNVNLKPYMWWNEETGEVSQMEYDLEEGICISGDAIANFTNFVVTNIPCGEEAFYIWSQNLFISNSSFSNMVGGASSCYYLNESSHELYLSSYNNGGIGLLIEGGNILISGTEFRNITAVDYDGYGKALYVGEASEILIENCSFIGITGAKYNYYDGGDNVTYDCHGSAFAYSGSSSVNIVDSRFINCSSDYGGALYIEGPVNITNSIFESNSAFDGGAIFIKDAKGVLIDNTNFTLNRAKHNGGAAYVYDNNEADNIIRDSVFLGNHAEFNGGAFLFNNTFDSALFIDYWWYNRTVMFSDGIQNLPTSIARHTFITDSLFENNTDHALSIIASDIAYGSDQTVIIFVAPGAAGDVYVNITDENGVVHVNSIYPLTDGELELPLGILPVGTYNVSANWASYVSYGSEYLYHENSTAFRVHAHFINVTADKKVIGPDEILTVTVKLNNLTNGTVNITVSNNALNHAYNDIPVVNGTVVYNITESELGDYNITATYNGDDMFYPISNTTNFTVFVKLEFNATVTVYNVTVYEKAVFNIADVPENFKGNVSIANNDGTVLYDGPFMESIQVIMLPAGNYTANVTFYGDDNYYVTSNMVNYTIFKFDLNVEVDASNCTVLDDVVFNITNIPIEYEGNISIINSNGSVFYDGQAENIINIGRLPSGNYTVNVTFYDDDNYGDKTVEVSFTVSKLDFTPNVTASNCTVLDDVVFDITDVPEKFNGNVSIVGADGSVLYDGPVNGTIDVGRLSSGYKGVNVTFYGDEIYNDCSNAVNFTVSQLDLNANVTVAKNLTAMDNVIFNITDVPEEFNGNVSMVDENGAVIYDGPVNGTVDVGRLSAGDKKVNVTFYGDDNYKASSQIVNFTISQAELDVNATVGDNLTADDPVVFNITNLPEDFKGNVSITDSNGTVLYNGSAKESIDIGKLTVGNYTTNVTFYGDNNYADKTVEVEFNITRINRPTIEANDMVRGWNSPYDYQARFIDQSGLPLANVEMMFSIGDKNYTVKTDSNGIAKLTDSKLPIGDYNVTCLNIMTGENVTQKLSIVKRIIENRDLTMDFRDGSYFIVRAVGDDGKPVGKGEKVVIRVNGIKYVCKTDDKGYAKLIIRLNPKAYDITAEYKGYKTTNKLVVKQTLKLVKKSVTVKKGKKITFKAKLKWSSGKPIKGKTIKFNVKGNVFKAKTNKKGIAKVTIKNKKTLKKLKAGKKYTFTASYYKNIVKGKLNVKK